MSDLINRQDIRYDSMLRPLGNGNYEECEVAYRDEIEAMPSAELIRCKDCKWWDKDDGSPYGYCLAMKHGYMSSNWEIGIYRRYKGDFFCADAEMKEAEDKSV